VTAAITAPHGNAREAPPDLTYDGDMTQAEAEERARTLQAGHPDRDTHRFVARRGEGDDWEVARIRVPDALKRTPLTPAIEARPRPPHPDDPRSGHEVRAPGVAGGLS
jgi:hypothetical protein